MTYDINGWLIIDKPKDITSFKVVSIVRKYYNIKKVGHAGTLDPMATGVLPIAVGEACKTINYMMDRDKEYEFTVKWGEETDTDDATGNVIIRKDKIPSETEIINILDFFKGKISQIPPKYSAIKVNGKRAYDMARNNQDFEIKPREVNILNLEYLSSKGNESNFKVSCSKGTYVRSLARDIAQKLSTYGHVTKLKRTKVGKFLIKNAILLENIEKTMYKHECSDLILPVEVVLDDIPVLTFTPEQAQDLRNGKQILLKDNLEEGMVFSVFSKRVLVALVKINQGLVKSLRVFNL